MKKLTKVQSDLLTKINKNKPLTGIFKYDTMKNICDFKSFDNSFNALLHKGYLKHFATNDFTNKFITTLK